MGQKSLFWCWGAGGGVSGMERVAILWDVSPQDPKPLRLLPKVTDLASSHGPEPCPSLLQLPGMKAELLYLPAHPAAAGWEEQDVLQGVQRDLVGHRDAETAS